MFSEWTSGKREKEDKDERGECSPSLPLFSLVLHLDSVRLTLSLLTAPVQPTPPSKHCQSRISITPSASAHRPPLLPHAPRLVGLQNFRRQSPPTPNRHSGSGVERSLAEIHLAKGRQHVRAGKRREEISGTHTHPPRQWRARFCSFGCYSVNDMEEKKGNSTRTDGRITWHPHGRKRYRESVPKQHESTQRILTPAQTQPSPPRQ